MLNDNAKFRIKGMLITGGVGVVLGVTGVPALIVISQASLIGSTIWGVGGFLMDEWLPSNKKSKSSTVEHEKDDFDKYYGGM